MLSGEPEVRVFRPGRPDVPKGLGDLEADIVEIVWEQPAVRDFSDATLAAINALADPKAAARAQAWLDEPGRRRSLGDAEGTGSSGARGATA